MESILRDTVLLVNGIPYYFLDNLNLVAIRRLKPNKGDKMKAFLFATVMLVGVTYSQPGFSKDSYGYTSQRAAHVNGYMTKSGRYVSPHMRTKSNSTGYDNYSTKGNVNPYTGKSGTRKTK